MSDKVNEKLPEVCEAPVDLTPTLADQYCFAADLRNQSQGKRSGITGEFQQPFVLVDSVRGREEKILGAKSWFNDDEDAVYAAFKDVTVQELQELERVFKTDHGMTVKEFLET